MERIEDIQKATTEAAIAEAKAKQAKIELATLAGELRPILKARNLSQQDQLALAGYSEAQAKADPLAFLQALKAAL